MHQRIFLACFVTRWAMLIQTLMEARPEHSYTMRWHAALCASNIKLCCTGCHGPSLPPLTLTLENWTAASLCPSAMEHLKHNRRFQVRLHLNVRLGPKRFGPECAAPRTCGPIPSSRDGLPSAARDRQLLPTDHTLWSAREAAEH